MTVTITDKSDEELSAEIKKVRAELSKTRRQGAILRQHRADDLARAQRTLELRKEDWNSLCYDVAEHRALKPVINTSSNGSPDYASVIRQVFASDKGEDEDKTKYLTWFCREESRTLRSLHYGMISKNQCELVIFQMHLMETDLRHTIDQVREEESFVESIHLTDMSVTHKNQKRLQDTYNYYIEIQEEAISILKEELRGQGGSSSNTNGRSRGSAARARVAENRRKREEMLKLETAKRRAKLFGHEAQGNDEDDDSSSMNLRVRGKSKRGKERSSSDGDKVMIDSSSDGSVDGDRRRPRHRATRRRPMSSSPTPGSDDGGDRPSRRTATRRAARNDNGSSSASPTALRGARSRARKSGVSPMSVRRREQLKDLYGNGSISNSSSAASSTAAKPSLMSTVDLN